jgi:hypothetical protein
MFTIKNKHISFEEESQFNIQGKKHGLSESTKKKKKNWEFVYIDKDPNHIFNSFLCTFLNTFQASFPVKHDSLKDKNDWITQGKKIFCEHKRSVCLQYEQY